MLLRDRRDPCNSRLARRASPTTACAWKRARARSGPMRSLGRSCSSPTAHVDRLLHQALSDSASPGSRAAVSERRRSPELAIASVSAAAAILRSPWRPTSAAMVAAPSQESNDSASAMSSVTASLASITLACGTNPAK